jgi:hypothetical protein
MQVMGLVDILRAKLVDLSRYTNFYKAKYARRKFGIIVMARTCEVIHLGKY